MSIKQKLFAAFLLTSIIPILIITAIIFSNARSALKNTQLARMESIVDSKVREIDLLFEDFKADMRIAQDYWNIKTNLPVLTQFIDDMSSPEFREAKEKLDGQLQTFQRVKKFDDFMLTDTSGKTVYVTNKDHAAMDMGRTIPNPDIFNKGKDGIYIGDVYHNKTTLNDFSLMVVGPAHDLKGRFIGLIVFEVDVDPLLELIQDTTGMGETGETLIGKIMEPLFSEEEASGPAPVTGKQITFISKLRHDPAPAVKMSVSLGDEKAIPMQEAVQGRNGSGISIDYRDKEIIAAWKHVPSSGWGLVAKIDTEEAFTPIRNLRYITIIFVVLIMGTIILLVILISRSIATPIRILQKGAEIIGSGNLDYKVGTDAKDEIGHLSRAFDQMTENLKTITSSNEAQARILNLIFKHTLDSMVLMDKNFNFIRVSESYARSCNRDSSEFSGKNHFKMYPSPFEQELEPYIKEKKIYQRQGRPFIFPDHPEWGTMYWNLELVPILDSDGEIELLLFTLKDVTENKRVEMEMRKFLMAIESSVNIITITDVEGVIEYVNPSFTEVTGFSKEEAVGRNANILVLGETTAEYSKVLWENILSGKAWRGELKNKKKGGDLYVVSTIVTPVKDNEGEITHFLVVQEDVTERQKMEQELIKTQKLESLGVLAGGIAHDFNNLLTTIVGNISLIMNSMDPEDKLYKRGLDSERACLFASKLTRQLITFAKGEAPVKELTSIGELIEEASGFVLHGSNVKCEFAFAEDLSRVMIDKGQLNQVISNLTINAKQAMTKGGTIKFHAKNTDVSSSENLPLSEGKYILISIEDQGGGIPEELLPKVFDPYFTTKDKGSGLGLAMSYSIIKEHDGHIELQSEAGEGTTFRIYLPASSSEFAGTRSEKTSVVVKGSGKVLVMDDDEAIRNFLVMAIGQLGYEVEAAWDGAEAIELYKLAGESGSPFDVVILDLTIKGGMGGRETIERLHSIDPETRAIVSSGYSTDPTLSDWEKYGFCGVVAKPYTLSQLSQALNKALKGDD